MWRNFLTIGLRSLAKNRAYSLISIGGLALGLAGCLIILSYINYERSYDGWLAGSDRAFQVQTIWRHRDQPVERSQNSPFPVRDLLASQFPQIDRISVLRAGPAPVMRGGVPVFIDTISVDPAFFDILRLPFAHGSAATALRDPQSIVLTETEATRQFGRSDVVGRTLSIGAGAGKQDYRIGAVLKDLPRNSSLRFGMVFRNDPAMFDGLPASFTGWSATQQQHYVRLRSGADAAVVNRGLPAWEAASAPVEAATMDLRLVPIGDIHLGDAQAGALAPGGDARTLVTFAAVALLILAMAVINFVNLSTARATQRAHEVGLRKTLGASRRQIIVQFFGESVLTTGVALLLGLAIAELAIPSLSAWTGAALETIYLGRDGMLLPALLLGAVTSVIGSLYPAIYLSRVRPAATLCKGQGFGLSGGGRLRASLVLLQFAIATGLIACTTVIYLQTRHVETIDPGYERDGLIQIDAAWRFAGDSSRYAASRRELLAIPGVVAAARTNLALAPSNRSSVGARRPAASAATSIGAYAVDADFFATMQAPLVAGRGFSDRFGGDVVPRAEADSAAAAVQLRGRGVKVVLNRSAVQALGFADPTAAVGKSFRLTLEEVDGIPATIVGVVGDMRVRTPRDPLEPIAYLYDPARTSQVLVRYQGARPAEVMAAIAKVWQRFEPEIPFQARFAEDILAEVHAADRIRGRLFAGFAALAIIIACLGLYSLAAFTAERRTKEIGIRKVFGATVADIVRLLAWQFSKPVVAANLIAWPAAWWAMRDWLNQFDVRIALTPGPFVLAGVIALGIALVTIIGHATRVARANPIHALRYE